ncbi:hypothetical protein GCM10023210_03680 [Chryseobacterium ginsengisoli]|uniref:Uncharacterized protein n=1 Tax=Chryseobacterium ginsengisoli TaxID=363853 RepID=A0ABP9LVA5_9FLAO
MKKFIYVIFFYSSLILSQVKVDVRLIKTTNEFDRGKLLEIKILNNSNFDYILPIDTTDFKTFYSAEQCINFSDTDEHRDLMLKVNLKNINDSISEMSFPHYKMTGQIDEKVNILLKR